MCQGVASRYGGRVTVLRVENGDLYLPAEAQTLVVVGEPEATLQGLRDAFELAVGDWFLDQTAGVDREVLVGNLASLVPPEVEVRRVLARVPGIVRVIRVNVRRITSRNDAVMLGPDAVARWDEAPGRILYVESKVTSKTAGELDLGFAFALPSTA